MYETTETSHQAVDLLCLYSSTQWSMECKPLHICSGMGNCIRYCLWSSLESTSFVLLLPQGIASNGLTQYYLKGIMWKTWHDKNLLCLYSLTQGSKEDKLIRKTLLRLKGKLISIKTFHEFKVTLCAVLVSSGQAVCRSIVREYRHGIANICASYVLWSSPLANVYLQFPLIGFHNLASWNVFAAAYGTRNWRSIIIPCRMQCVKAVTITFFEI